MAIWDDISSSTCRDLLHVMMILEEGVIELNEWVLSLQELWLKKDKLGWGRSQKHHVWWRSFVSSYLYTNYISNPHRPQPHLLQPPFSEPSSNVSLPEYICLLFWYLCLLMRKIPAYPLETPPQAHYAHPRVASAALLLSLLPPYLPISHTPMPYSPQPTSSSSFTPFYPLYHASVTFWTNWHPLHSPLDHLLYTPLIHGLHKFLSIEPYLDLRPPVCMRK